MIPIVLFNLLLVNYANSQWMDEVGAECVDHFYTSRCVKNFECNTLKDAIKKGIRPKLCGFEGNVAIICCPPENSLDSLGSQSGSNQNPGQPSSPLVGQRAQKMCAEYAKAVFFKYTSDNREYELDQCNMNFEPLIVGGTAAFPKEFPHMVLIGYGERDINWGCGGSLISKRHILTAAHCVVLLKNGMTPKWVKLGELDTTSTTDDADPQDLKVVASYAHPKYNSRLLLNDIAILELEKDVTFSSYIRPACLHLTDYIPSKDAIASGWGRVQWESVSRSGTLLKVNLDLVNNTHCESILKPVVGNRISQGLSNKGVLCAGGGSNKDTCKGDSGGPLQIKMDSPYCMYGIVGITSYGHKCGKGLPGVYTKVSHYIQWIENTVWPNAL